VKGSKICPRSSGSAWAAPRWSALSSTNVIENLIGRVRALSDRVKRWKSGQMILRWSSAGVLEAEQGFRRLKGYREMKEPTAALLKHDAQLDSAVPVRAATAA
jgi:hypothetical protein